MKLGKLSLVAVMALSTGAFALDNVKVNGQAKLIYQTADFETSAADAGKDTGLFNQGTGNITGASYGGAAAGGASLTLGATANLADNISAGAEMQAFSTLGLENNLVSNTMIGNAANVGIADSWAMSQAYIAATVGKTTVKIGRQELDTPLAFTEKWNILKNTFDAAVVLNGDLPNTTLVAAWVGKDNGQANLGNGANYAGSGRTAALYGATEGDSAFDNFATKGAYAFAAVNKSIPDTTVQAWYYNVLEVADAMWLQADTKIAGMVNLGVQYSTMDPKLAAAPTLDDSTIMAVKASADVAGVNVYAAYSKADEDGTVGFANVATGDKTKIYTGDNSIYMDGIVTAPGATAYKVGASTAAAGVNLHASFASAADVAGDGNDITAWDVSASSKVGPVALTAIYTDVSNDSTMYAGRDNSTLRIIAALPF